MKSIVFATLFGFMFSLFILSCDGKKPTGSDPSEEAAANSNPGIDVLSRKIAADPENAGLYAARAEIFYQNEGYDEAIRDMVKALELDSLHVGYHHLLADIYLDYFQSRMALTTLERAAALYPDQIPTLLKLCEFQLILKKHGESMRTIDRVLKIDPQNAEALFMFGMNFKELGDTIKSINSFQSAVEIDPDLVDAWINLGLLYAAINDPLADRYFSNALIVAPENIAALHAYAFYLQGQNDLEGAIELYQKINVADPQYEEAYFNSGLLHLDLDSIEQAFHQFDLAIKVSPLHIRAYYYRGLAAEMKGDSLQARSDYRQALKLAPGYESAQRALLRLSE